MAENIETGQKEHESVGSSLSQSKTNFEKPQEGRYDPQKQIRFLGKEIKRIGNDIKETKESIKTATTFMVWVAGAIVVAFFIASIPIFFDYFKNNEERYEKFINKAEEIKNDFYSKEDLKNFIDESNKNKQILDCLKNKEYFTIRCFQ